MQITFSPLPNIGFHLFVILLLMALAGYLAQYHKAPGVLPLIITMTVKAVWLTCDVLITGESSFLWLIIWYKVRWLVASVTVPCWLLLILQASGQEHCIPRRILRSLLILPIIPLLLIFTNEWHGWFPVGGVLYWSTLAYHYLLILSCFYFNIRWIRRSLGLRRWQGIAMILAPVLGVSGHIAKLFSHWPYTYLLFPAAFLLSSLIWCWALLYLRLLNITFVAKDTVIDNMHDGFAVVDRQGYLYEINFAAATMLKTSASQAIGRQASEIFASWPALLDMTKHQGVKELDTFFERDGGNRCYELHSSPLIDHSGRFLGTVIVWHDATERHLAHMQLKVMEESRRRLLANISHDLRTPVSSILIHSELLLEEITESPEQQRIYLKRIHAKMLGFSRLIQDLFELAKIESQQDRFHMVPISVATVVQNIYEKYLLDVQNAGIRFEYRIAVGGDVMISADADRLDQVFANMISNAIRYTKPGGTISISCEFTNNQVSALDVKGTPRALLLKVADDGAGIASEHVSNIFERFYRGSNARENPAEHSGLGLAIAKEIIVAHNGHIWIEEAVCRGCTVCFTLPTL